MPVLLSLPIPRISTGLGEYLPIRIPFPFWRIASILPQALNEPIKTSLLALFKLAWSAKLQIPVLITVVFMACDIRLQLEINIFWETNNRNGNQAHGTNNRNALGQRRTVSREDMRRAAIVAAGLYQQQRQRLIREMRANQMRIHQLANQANILRNESLQFPRNAPLAAEEDSDLDGSEDDFEDDDDDDDTLTCSQRSTASEAGSFYSDGDDTEGAEDEDKNETKKIKKKRKKRSRPSSGQRQGGQDDEDCTTTDDDDDDEDDDDDDDDEDDDDDLLGGGGTNGGSSHGGNGNRGYRDGRFDPDYDDDMDDSSNNDPGGGYGSPLVVEVEIRHRPLFGQIEAIDNLKASCKKMSATDYECKCRSQGRTNILALSAPCGFPRIFL